MSAEQNSLCTSVVHESIGCYVNVPTKAWEHVQTCYPISIIDIKLYGISLETVKCNILCVLCVMLILLETLCAIIHTVVGRFKAPCLISAPLEACLSIGQDIFSGNFDQCI